MKTEFVNAAYYTGFEGEPEIAFVYEMTNERQVLKLWTGYFDTIMDLMCQYESYKNGILHEYYVHEGWYEESPWEVTQLDATIQLFKSFHLQSVDVKAAEASPNIVPVLPDVAREIIQFLEQARINGSTVYIVYD
ncbi:hypothetical protein [Cohnella sp. GCM10027633]|uniref:hypothetical protein n=1 Tax=unclassified Cohnella TaxID=2636738 RepID=UPI00363CB95B